MATEADAKKILQEQRSARERAREEGQLEGKPTPTQEELDLHALGVPLDQHEDDGSGTGEWQFVLQRVDQPGRPAGLQQQAGQTGQQSSQSQAGPQSSPPRAPRTPPPAGPESSR